MNCDGFHLSALCLHYRNVSGMLNSVTATRARRPNAGSKMARLLNEEEEDDFYTNAYGGFAEVSLPIIYTHMIFVGLIWLL